MLVFAGKEVLLLINQKYKTEQKLKYVMSFNCIRLLLHYGLKQLYVIYSYIQLYTVYSYMVKQVTYNLCNGRKNLRVSSNLSVTRITSLVIVFLL